MKMDGLKLPSNFKEKVEMTFEDWEDHLEDFLTMKKDWSIVEEFKELVKKKLKEIEMYLEDLYENLPPEKE